MGQPIAKVAYALGEMTETETVEVLKSSVAVGVKA
jgi:hypothetical protein